MLQNKVSSEVTEMKARPGLTPKQAQIRQLQEEIDKLALLVNEAKRQSDRIQQAADALGDAVVIRLEQSNLGSGAGDKRARLRRIVS